MDLLQYDGGKVGRSGTAANRKSIQKAAMDLQPWISPLARWTHQFSPCRSDNYFNHSTGKMVQIPSRVSSGVRRAFHKRLTTRLLYWSKLSA